MNGRQLFDVPLEPTMGSRFQPTGFPDLGAARFQRPLKDGTWQDALLVESAQSMANRLEGTAWDDAVDGPVALFDGLPYVRVVDPDGAYITSSRTEAHRLASVFVKEAKLDGNDMLGVITERLGLENDRPIPARDVATAVFALDPFCLLHGVFFADKKWPGQPKIARALTAAVEAQDVRRADSGGVKKDHVRHSLSDTGGTSEGYGTVPFHRVEWTAAEIVGQFSLDLDQIAGYGLPDEASQLLVAIARWEIRTLLDRGLRLRTACDLTPAVDEITDRSGNALPSAEALAEEIRGFLPAVKDLVEEGAPIEVVWTPKKASK